MAKKIQFGDIFEVNTNKGLAYFQYTHEHTDAPKMGSLIRVISGYYKKRPDDFKQVADSPTKFKTFVPLQKSLNVGLVKFVANEEVPRDSKKFPLFRNGEINPETKKVDDWWFWDGKKDWRVGKISEKQKAMPILELVTVPTLIKQIESGWTPESDPYT